MKTVTQVAPVTLEAFTREFNESPFEWIDGEKRILSPSVAGPNYIAKLIFRALLLFEDQGFGEAFTEAVFVLTNESNWVKGSRVPGVMFFSTARLANYRRENPDWPDKPYILVPDFVVEVVSPTDIYSEVNLKVDANLADGVRLIWVIDPQRKRVTVYENGQINIIRNDKMLSGEPVIPDLKIRLTDLFQ